MTFIDFVPILLGISLASVSGAYLYLILKDKVDDNCENATLEVNEIEMNVPKSCFSKNNESEKVIKEIQKKSNTKVTIREDTNKCNVCKIEGNFEGRERAKSIICSIISNQFANLSEEIERSKESNVQPDFPYTDIFEETSHADDVVTLPPFEQIQVFVSSVMDPGCFWVQLIDSKATELEELEKEMNAFYAVSENCKLHTLGDVFENDLVAAPFNSDASLYRARVVEVVNGEKGVELELFYLDYGDDERIERERAFSLSPEFLKLKFQAVQCSLANVEPRKGKWSEEAVDFFCAITDVAKWKILEAKVVSHGKKGHPVLQLFEIKDGRHIDIADELVRQKHGYYSNKQCAQKVAAQARMQLFIASGEEDYLSDDEFEFG